MPEFEHDKKVAFQTLAIHLKDAEAVAAFSALLDQAITPRTKSLSFPSIEIARCADKRYTTTPPPDDESTS